MPDVLIAIISVCALGLHAPSSPDLRVLSGKALVAYDSFYPIRTNDTETLYLDWELFVKTVNYLSQHPSPHAMADLIYLGNSSNVTLLSDRSIKVKYFMLTQQPDYVVLSEVDREEDRIFQPYANTMNGIGQTSTGTPIEAVSHSTHSPLRSTVAVQNPISSRRLGNTNTSFDIQLIKNYDYGEGQGQGRGISFVSYDLILKDGRAVKPTTAPIFHNVYGLIGFIYINISISKMDKEHPEYIEHFVGTFEVTIASDAIGEIIQSSKYKN